MFGYRLEKPRRRLAAPIILATCLITTGQLFIGLTTALASNTSGNDQSDGMHYFLAAFMLKAYIICDGNNIDKCGFSSWVEFEPVRYEFESKAECMEVATRYQKKYRKLHKKTMNIVFSIPACPRYRHTIEPQAFDGSDIG